MRKSYSFLVSTLLLTALTLSCTGNKTPGTTDADSSAVATDSLATATENWQDVNPQEAIALIEEFYSHAPTEQGSYAWDEAILHQYLAPNVLTTLHKKVKESTYDQEATDQYATWLLTGIDNSEQICVSQQNQPAEPTDDGRYCKRFTVYYWADAMLYGVQELYYTVKSNGDRSFITQIDSLSEDAAQQVWDQLEDRNRWREVESQAEDLGGMENLTDDQMDSLYEHALE